MPRSGVELAVLGPVHVTGAAEPFRRPAALELAVYLAFHRHAVRHCDWAIAIWPDRSVVPATVHSTASDCRRALGRAAPGEHHLPRGAQLKLGDSVTTDVEHFEAIVASRDPREVLRAMHLVRGPLFAGLRRTDWAVFDGTQARIEALVVHAALGGAEALIGRGHGDEAEWIVRQALRLSPYDERLYRMLFRATDAQGNRVGLHGAMADVRALAGEVDLARRPFGEAGRGGPPECLHPETTALYLDLLGRSPAARGDATRL